jgi:hypothetical protein
MSDLQNITVLMHHLFDYEVVSPMMMILSQVTWDTL